MLKRNAAARGAGAAQSPTAGSVDGHGPASLYNSSSQQQQSGATPNFELSADGMFSAADVQLNEPTRHQPLHDLDQARDSRSRSVPPQSLFDRRTTDDTRRLPPIDTFQLPNSKRRNLFDESEKRPTSPHITSATPTSARHQHLFHDRLGSSTATNRVASPLQDAGPETTSTYNGSFKSRANKSPPPGRLLSPPLRQTSLGRAAVNAAQSLMDAVAGRVSPANFQSRNPPIDERDSISDDEAGKGHGKKAAGRFTPITTHKRASDSLAAYAREKSPHISFQDGSRHQGIVAEPEEIIEGFSGNVEWRASISESRRATPAAYRPRPGTPRKRGSGGQTAAHDDSTDIRIPSSRSTSHSIHIGSPIVVPQARRGAITLRPRRKRRSSRPTKPQLTAKQQCMIFLASLVRAVKLLASPVELGHRIREGWIDAKIGLDEAFRHPVSGARCWWPPWLEAYVPLLIWLGISLSSTALVITFHTQVFTGLDHLATYLQQLGLTGRVLLGSLIFITTFPPLPLYSTLIILCGFAFGLWQGFIISYIAALSGAITVFLLSRSLLKDWMVNLLNKSGGLKKVVRAIEKQPKLLFLVRLAPYPYNLMNTLLASSPTLTLRTYTTCTALALPKLLVHTGLGTSIKNFAAYNGAKTDGEISKDDREASRTAETVKHVAGFVGIGLCIGIFLYLFWVARRAVDDLDDEGDDGLDGSDEELLSSDMEEGADDTGRATYDSGEEGVDMREHYGPGSRGFRNGYAPVSSLEDRMRDHMRHSVVLFEAGPSARDEHELGGRSSSLSGSGSGGPSFDLAEKIAEMEAHAEVMELGDQSSGKAQGGLGEGISIGPGRGADGAGGHDKGL